MTKEHVVPEALGGRLTSRFLCKECNSRLGHHLEGRAKVRHLARRLEKQIPQLSAQIEERQSYVTVGAGPGAPGHIRKGQFALRATKLPDGSLIQATSVASQSIRQMLLQEGLPRAEVVLAMRRFEEAPENIKVQLSRTIEVVKWSVTGLKPSLEGPRLDLLIPVKSAYEFLSLHVGSAIYRDTRPLREIRQSLLDKRIDDEQTSVERLHAPDAKPFHGLAFEGNDPYAKVQLRLFGQLAFRVHFKRLSVSGPRGMYTHDLASNEESVLKLLEDDA